MTPHEHNAAMLLGYDEAMWDNGDVPAPCTHPWVRLALDASSCHAAARYAASALPHCQASRRIAGSHTHAS